VGFGQEKNGKKRTKTRKKTQKIEKQPPKNVRNWQK
jgi:hypothetical protein